MLVSIFLFHELPKNVRRDVLHEMYRCSSPGLPCYSTRPTTDSHELKDVLRRFPETYHEPYYKSYLQDDWHHRRRMWFRCKGAVACFCVAIGRRHEAQKQLMHHRCDEARRNSFECEAPVKTAYGKFRLN